jgi:5'-nucleotidase
MTMVKKLLQQRKDENRNPIYLNIGDNFQGTLWYELLGWNVTSTFLNILPADATTLGNHEFDRGVQEVVHFLEHLKSPVVVANLDDTDEPSIQNLYKKSIVIERGGRKIGLVGALVVATVDISNPENLHILNEIESVKKESERLRSEEGVEIIVVLSHCGLVIDRRMALEGGSAIDVIVGGHSHTLLYSGTPVPGPDNPPDVYPIVYEQENGHKVLIVQASAYTKYLGDLVVYFDDQGEAVRWEGNPIFMDNSIEPDAEILREMAPWKAVVDAIAERELGEVKTTLYQRDCAFGECNIGSFITDAFVDYFIDHPDYQEEGSWTYGTISCTNAGGIRTTLAPGIVTYDDLFTSLPFQNTIDTFELRGDHLLAALEFSAEWYSFYNFLQFSGMRVVFNVTEPFNHRVVSVDVLCRQCEIPKYEKLDLTRNYRMIVPSFIGAGGNGFVPFTHRTNHRKGDAMDIEVVEKYLKKMSPVIQKKDGRNVVLK